MTQEEELSLLEGFRRGDEQAFEQLFQHYYPRLCLFVSSFVAETKEAEDIAGESFIRLWQGARSFESLQHLKASLYQTARRLGINQQTSRERRSRHIETYSSKQVLEEDSYLQHIVRAEAMGELHQAIATLPPKAQQIVKLSYLEGFSNQEIADQMNISLQTVKNQKMRALGLLRDRLRRDSFQLLVAALAVGFRF